MKKSKLLKAVEEMQRAAAPLIRRTCTLIGDTVYVSDLNAIMDAVGAERSSPDLIEAFKVSFETSANVARKLHNGKESYTFVYGPPATIEPSKKSLLKLAEDVINGGEA